MRYSGWNHTSCRKSYTMRFSSCNSFIPRNVCTHSSWFQQCKTHLCQPSDWCWRLDRDFYGSVDDNCIHTSNTGFSKEWGEVAITLQQTNRLQCILVFSSPSRCGIHITPDPWDLLVLGPPMVPENGKNSKWKIFITSL